ncbi:MAG TPA: cupin domain-containing protein [Candidatus Sulfomarinibacteraceae bacterium]|nr:cupin domain-containing protein [Candidatus Sulfomarinibacteraceae bacterium]
MPIEVRRFGVGFRRPEGPPGSHGLTGGVIHSDGRGIVAELAFARGGAIAPHDNPNTTWFCVIEGGGWVAVGDERRRVASGDAVLWPAGVTHGAWTDHGEMRAIVIEFAGADDSTLSGVLEGAARELGPGEAGAASRGEGRLAEQWREAGRHDRTAGEPS